jgi:hypothetical protein
MGEPSAVFPAGTNGCSEIFNAGAGEMHRTPPPPFDGADELVSYYSTRWNYAAFAKNPMGPWDETP